MNIKANLSMFLLALLCGCSSAVLTNKNLANAIPEVQQGQMLPITAIANIANTKINLEVAKTPNQQAIGLMFRESLSNNQGMLFPFESKRVARFWMKNVSISLDMIFLNGNQVINIAHDVPPCTSEPCPVYGPNEPVNRVIELRGGRARELGIKPGDTVSITNLNP